MENNYNFMEEINVRQEMEEMEQAPRGGFVDMKFSAEDAFIRMQAVKKAQAIIKEAIDSTGGMMPKKNREAYEIMYGACEAVKTYERDIVRDGR